MTINHLFRWSTALACLVLSTGTPLTLAAGSAFTYQGRLRDNGTPATGAFDLQFQLYDAVTAGIQIGGTLALEDVGVTNGLFSVVLDFGASVFTGEDRWLEIGVRPGAETGAYTTLSPRRAIKATPYAIQAASAATAVNATTAASLSGTLPATQVTGTLEDARLSANVALLDSSPVFTGTASASAFNGQGVLRWQTVAGASQAAAPNTAYLANSASMVSLSLPAVPNVGDVIRVAGAGAGGWSLNQATDQWLLMPGEPAAPGTVWTPRDAVRNWTAVASSTNGTNLVAAGVNEFIYTSTDAGVTWTARMTDHPRSWWAVASSADGLKLVAAAQNDWIYTSTDGGMTWTARLTDAGRGWSSVASSANGQRLMAIEGAYGTGYDSIYISTDGGTNWTQTYYRSGAVRCGSAVMSADGNTMAALEDAFLLLLSTDGGANWSGSLGPGSQDLSLAMSADGQKIFVGAEQVCSSSDLGATWTPLSPLGNWSSLACSADGVFLAAASWGSQIYTSTNSGATWTARESARDWNGMASSADGQELVAVVYRGRIYTSQTRLGAVASLAGAQGAEAGLLYLGNNQWQITDTSGTLTVNGVVRPTDSVLKVSRSGDTMTGPLKVPGLWVGNSSLGLTNPAYVVDVGDRIGLRGGASGTAGVWLHNTNGLQAVFLGLMDEGLTGFWGNGCGWNLVMNRTNGYVGIGTTAPSTKLQVNGTVTATAFVGNGAALTGLTLAQLPGGVVTNGETGLSLTGTFSGDGAGLSQLNSYNLTGPITVAPMPSLAGHIDNGGTARSVAVAGNYCYLANGEDGLRIYDISDPANPTNVAHMLDGGSYGYAMGVAVAGHYCYLANDSDGLRIYDVSNPASPVNVGRITGSGGPASGVAVAGNYCYLANFSAGLQIIDISTPTSPVSRSSTFWGDRPCSVTVAGNYCYLGSWDGGLRIANVSNPSSPSPVGWINNGGMALGLAVAGNYCYLANHSDGLRVYDVSNPASPVNVGHVNDGGYALAVAVTGNLCYLGAGGLRVYDVSTPSNPVPAGYVSSSGGGQGVAVAGNYCYLAAGSDGLRVHALGTATIPSLITSGLTVKDRMQLSPGASGTAGLFLQSTDGANAAFLGMMDDGFAGLWGSGCGWNLVMNRTNGNVGIGNTNPSNKLMVVSARCDGSSWINASDRHLKQSFSAVDPRAVLEKVTALPVQTWSYKAQPAEKHLGPVAQDFYAAFGLGTDDKAISTVDESGVALAAIQGLNQKVDDTVKQKDAEIQALKASVAELQEAVRRLTSTAK